MKYLQSIEINAHNREEVLHGFEAGFPCLSSYVELDRYVNRQTTWHWHKTAELFYVQSGCLEYTTPHGKWMFRSGEGGFVNTNVLHCTKVVPSQEKVVQLVHLFDTELISGGQGNRIHSKYVQPLTAAGTVELIPLSPESPQQAALAEKIRALITADETAWGYELGVRQQLTEIWAELFEMVRPQLEQPQPKATDEKMKTMMGYIHERYWEPISVEALAEAVHISKRACFRLFRETLHMSPVEYMTDYRLHKACHQLRETEASITQIAYGCGFGSASYFGKLFRARFGCSPAEYRREWHDRNNQ